LIGSILYITAIISDSHIELSKSNTWALLAALLANGVFPMYCIRIILRGIRRIVGDIKGLMLVVFLSLYSHFVYPKLSPAFGGGKRQKLSLIAKADQIEILNSIGFQLAPDDRKIGPLELIFEASDYYVVAPPEGFTTENKVKAIRIRKDTIDLALYFQE
jgi:hypothetical protein